MLPASLINNIVLFQVATLQLVSGGCIPYASPIASPFYPPCAPTVLPAAPLIAPTTPIIAPTIIRDSSVANGLVDTMQLLVANDLLQHTLPPYLPLTVAPLPPCAPIPACNPLNYYPYIF